MSTTVILNRWDGAQAEDVRTTENNQSEKSQNFDIFSEPYRLNPHSDSIAETSDVDMDYAEISDVGVCAISGTDYIVGVGFESSGSSATTFYTKTTMTGTFAKQASTSTGVFVKGSGVTYKKLAYAVEDNTSGSYKVLRFNGAGSITTVGTISATSGKDAKCFVHPEDNVLYIVVDNVISTWDGSSFVTVSSILPANYTTSSITNYGGYLAIVMNAQSGNRNPVCLLWGRDVTLNTLQASLDLGEGYVGVVENLNNNLIFVMSPYRGFSSNNQNKIMVKGYSGGAVDTLVEVNDDSTLSIGQVHTYKAVKNNKVYFGFRNSDCVWCFGKNKAGEYKLTQDRYITNGTQISTFPATQTLGGISIIGDVMWVGGFSQSGLYTLMRSRTLSTEGLLFTATSKFTTTKNPSMPVGDRYKQKQLEAVQISFTGASTGVTTLKYSIDGETFETAIAKTNATGELVVEATADVDGAPFKSGREITFQPQCTGGSRIKEVRYRYSVLETTL